MLENKIESIERLEISKNDVVSVKIVIKKREKGERIKTLCSSEVRRLVEEKYSFKSKETLSGLTLTNVSDDNREGIWIFMGEFMGNEEEKWLYKNPIAINSVLKGIEEAKEGEFVTLPEAAANLAIELETASEEKQSELERKINKKVGKTRKLIVKED